MKLMLPTQSRQWFALAVLLLIAAVVRWPFTTLDFNSLLTTYLADDAFYYFKIASHLAIDHRITYDGEQLSNGFHPLWLAVITPFYTVANNGVDFVYRVQWLMFGIDLLTVVALFHLLQKLKTGLLIAFIGTLLFCIHSSFVDIQMNGLETSLNTLLLFLLCKGFIEIYRQENIAWRVCVCLGALTGLAFLARTDNAITVLLLFACLAWYSRKQWRINYPRLLSAGVVAGLIVLPWLLWNWLNFGSFVQSSGKIETIYWGEPQFNWQHTAFSFLMLPWKVYEQLQVFGRLFITPVSDAKFVSIGVVVFFAGSLLWLKCSRRAPREIKALAAFCAAVLAVFIYHAAFRSFVRTWYYIPVAMVLLLLVATVVAQMPKKWGVSVLLLCVLSVVMLYSPLKLTRKVAEPSSHQVVADWINANTPPNAVIGSMNSGVLSYLAQRKVINLDGVVDVRSMQAHWQKRQPEYIHERGIHYLVDNDGARAFFCRENPLHTCMPVFSFGDVRNSNKVVEIVNK